VATEEQRQVLKKHFQKSGEIFLLGLVKRFFLVNLVKLVIVVFPDPEETDSGCESDRQDSKGGVRQNHLLLLNLSKNNPNPHDK
jgi:hypothetical protein